MSFEHRYHRSASHSYRLDEWYLKWQAWHVKHNPSKAMMLTGDRNVRRIGALALLPIATFCGFGFLASFEGSTSYFLAFRVGYAVIGIGFLLLSGGLLFKRTQA